MSEFILPLIRAEPRRQNTAPIATPFFRPNLSPVEPVTVSPTTQCAHDMRSTSDKTTNNRTKVVCRCQTSLLGRIGDDAVVPNVGHRDESWSFRYRAQDALVVPFEYQSDGAEEIEQEKERLAGYPPPWFDVHSVHDDEENFRVGEEQESGRQQVEGPGRARIVEET